MDHADVGSLIFKSFTDVNIVNNDRNLAVLVSITLFHHIIRHCTSSFA